MGAQDIVYILMALAVGALGGFHVPINGALGSRINSVFVAPLPFMGLRFW